MYNGGKELKKIAIIGGGQIGSRHLQGLAKSDMEISIEVVDTSIESRKVAETRFNEIPKKNSINNVEYLNNITQLSNELDLVIVATSANVRFDIVKYLLENINVHNLVLEKVLFQRLDDYDIISELLVETQTKCWVNHPRRMFPFYLSLKKKLSECQKINFAVSGGNWGLACNGLHFIDCFSYLSNENNLILDSEFLDEKIYKSKRDGFIEINGMINGKIGENTFSINCFSTDVSPEIISITSDKYNVVIDEFSGWYRVTDKQNKWESSEIFEKIVYYQSELTNILIYDIFNNDCMLPTYNDAMILHKKYIRMILDYINSINKVKSNLCPIT